MIFVLGIFPHGGKRGVPCPQKNEIPPPKYQWPEPGPAKQVKSHFKEGPGWAYWMGGRTTTPCAVIGGCFKQICLKGGVFFFAPTFIFPQIKRFLSKKNCVATWVRRFILFFSGEGNM